MENFCGNNCRYRSKAGVAASTVSRVLNNDPTLSVTKEKRQLIKKIAYELAYLSPTQRKQQKKVRELACGSISFQNG